MISTTTSEIIATLLDMAIVNRRWMVTFNYLSMKLGGCRISIQRKEETAVDWRQFFSVLNQLKKNKDMDAKIKFLELKEQWKKAADADRPAIEQETDAFLDSLSENDKKKVFDAIDEDFVFIHKEAVEIQEIVNVRKKLEPVLPVISISHLTKTYFKKSPNWFYQRMNGNRVNGKTAKFSSDDIKTLNFAISDIAKQLSTVQF